MTRNTLFLLVTCTLEQTRMDALDKVVTNLNEMEYRAFKGDMIVFDNASTFPGSLFLLKKNFINVVRCNQNAGFWSAIKWTLDSYESIMGRKYDYLYVIESDILHTQDAFQKLASCENFLDENLDVGFVRTEEFSVLNKHLYDKRQVHHDSRRYAWVVQDNFITGQPIKFSLADEQSQIYRCNFLAKVPVLSRISAMSKIFEQLSKMNVFNEMDYQRLYHDMFKTSALLDGGIWHSKLGNENPLAIVNGSWNANEKIGYRSTRKDSIVSLGVNDVVRI